MATNRGKYICIGLIVLGALIPPLNAVIIMTSDWIDTPTGKPVYALVLTYSIVLGAALCVTGLAILCDRVSTALIVLPLVLFGYALDVFVCVLATAIIGIALHGFQGIQ